MARNKKRNKSDIRESIEFKILADKMDKRDNYYLELEKFHNTYGFVPDEHKINYAIYVERGFKPWRDQKAVVKKVIKNAKRIIHIDQKIIYLAKTYKKPFDEIRKLYQALQDWKVVVDVLEGRVEK